MTVSSSHAAAPAKQTTGPGVVAGRVPSPWSWAVVVLAMLGASGGLRAWQGRRLVAASSEAAEAPIRLSQLPLRLGQWKATDDKIEIDDQTIMIAGCTDYLARNYSDDETGVTLTVLIAYGPAERIVGHTPDVCYPSAGFAAEDRPADRAARGVKNPAVFRSAVFGKKVGEAYDRIEVYHGFRHAGRWSPDAAASRKRFRHEPAMFKIQIQRPVAKGERRDIDNPSERFLSVLVPELEKEIEEARDLSAGR